MSIQPYQLEPEYSSEEIEEQGSVALVNYNERDTII